MNKGAEASRIPFALRLPQPIYEQTRADATRSAMSMNEYIVQVLKLASPERIQPEAAAPIPEKPRSNNDNGNGRPRASRRLAASAVDGSAADGAGGTDALGKY